MTMFPHRELTPWHPFVFLSGVKNTILCETSAISKILEVHSQKLLALEERQVACNLNIAQHDELRQRLHTALQTQINKQLETQDHHTTHLQDLQQCQNEQTQQFEGLKQEQERQTEQITALKRDQEAEQVERQGMNEQTAELGRHRDDMREDGRKHFTNLYHRDDELFTMCIQLQNQQQQQDQKMEDLKQALIMISQQSGQRHQQQEQVLTDIKENVQGLFQMGTQRQPLQPKQQQHQQHQPSSLKRSHP